MELCTKAWWSTEAEAKAALVRVRARPVPNTWKLPHRVYLCTRCFCWHMTSKEKIEWGARKSSGSSSSGSAPSS